MAIEFRFHGGPNDGKTMRDDVYRDGQHLFVEQWWVATNEGTIGTQFYLYSEKGSEQISQEGVEADFVGHYYEVVDRSQFGNDMVVKCQYLTAKRLA